MGLQLFFFLICIPWSKGVKIDKLISGEGKITQTKDFYLKKMPLLPLSSNGNNAEKWKGCHHTSRRVLLST